MIALLAALGVAVVCVAKDERLAVSTLFVAIIAIQVSCLRQTLKSGEQIGSFGSESEIGAPLWALVLFAIFLAAVAWTAWVTLIR